MSSSEDDVMNAEPDVEDDLFGDEEEAAIENPRELSDEELDSGDDENRYDRAQKTGDAEENQAGGSQELRISENTIWRHPLPKPVDEEFNSLRLPKFLGIEPHVFKPETFKVPTADHHSTEKSTNFSASATAASTMRYRKDPSTGRLESNTMVYRWSDGSTTIAVGDQHYELQTKPLAPPRDKPYQEVQDSHYYVASPSVAAQVLVLFGHMTNQYTVRPNKDIEDDALERLQRSLAAAARGGHKGDDKNGPELITNTQDPELQKKRAELAEKERMRAQRRRETAAEKANLHAGPGRGRSGGLLNVEDLEGRRRAPGSGRKMAGVKRPKRRPEYDSDDDLPRGRHREDEYDKEDDFLASSDEELDGPEGDDDEEEEMLDDESERDEPKAKKQKTSKPEETSDADADADAEADLDDDEALAAPIATEGPAGRGRKRNIIEDDEDE
ncbi:hypothetical protein G7Y89_g648 [Cudoniella acicularis]|uniref:RNA polymerase-associated protein LEO1 n=1 Tax=Cudoniella acicularis TaxID=354080 RepID=A0A8H4RWR8_9HELO|nr:hypothetical protein G7Y89_g648 [Cudoniella acicularis]